MTPRPTLSAILSGQGIGLCVVPRLSLAKEDVQRKAGCALHSTVSGACSAAHVLCKVGGLLFTCHGLVPFRSVMTQKKGKNKM